MFPEKQRENVMLTKESMLKATRMLQEIFEKLIWQLDLKKKINICTTEKHYDI